MNEPGSEPVTTGPDVTVERETLEERLKQEQKFEAGARWFHWLAGLSIINSIIVVAGGSWSFLFGLGITQIVTGAAVGLGEERPDLAVTAKIVGLLINLVVAGMFVLFGFLARRRKLWVFAVGMAIYVADAAIFVWVKDWLGLAFHVWVLMALYGGAKMCHQLNQQREAERGAVEAA